MPAFVITAALGLCVVIGGLPYGQFLSVALAGSDLKARFALSELPSGGKWVLLADCVFAAAYALLISIVARILAPHSASPAAGRLLANAIWIGAASDITENLLILRLLDDPGAGGAALLRGASVLKFAIFIAACGWIGGAAWKNGLLLWSAVALFSAAWVFLSLFPILLAS